MATDISIITDFDSYLPPTSYALGDGSWSDHTISGGELKIGVAGTATNKGGCSASFPALDLRGIVFNNSQAGIPFDAAWGIFSGVRIALTSASGEISWEVVPTVHIWPQFSYSNPVQHALWIPLCGYSSVGGTGSLPKVNTIDWSAVTGYSISGISGFCSLQFAWAFRSLKIVRVH